jgi:hypothetical protein
MFTATVMHRTEVMIPKILICTLIAFTSLFGSASRLEAAPISLSINVPSFMVPIGGESGILNVYADGSAVADPSGFNALGSQALTLAGNSTTSGELLLNFHFSGFPLGDPDFIVTEAILSLSIDDLDFQTDFLTQNVTLKERAIITSAGGRALELNLNNYLPTSDTPTDDTIVNLNPINLVPNLIPAGYFSDPFVLSIWMHAQVWNTSSQSIHLINTSEQIAPRLQMDVTTQRVPEPSAMLLFGTSLAILGSFRSRQRAQGVHARGGAAQ